MGNLNKVMLIGYLGQDPEKKVSPSGISYVKSSIAISSKFKNKEGLLVDKTEWVRLSLWGKNADIFAEYTKKGSQIYVEGRITTNEWTDDNGNKRYSTEISVSNFQFLDKKSENSYEPSYQTPTKRPAQPQPQPHSQNDGSEAFEEEDTIPF